MGADYIPDTDGGAANWMMAFARRLAAFPERYFISQSEADMVQRSVQAYADAFLLARDERTRNKITVARKDTERNSAKSVCRVFAGLLQANRGISDDDRIALGLPVRRTTKSKIEVPLSSPYISVVAATMGAHQLTFADTLTPNRRAKPHGAHALQLFVHIGDEKAVSHEEASFYRALTQTPAVVRFDGKDSGKWATYFARWANRRGDTGNWSAGVSFRIAA